MDIASALGDKCWVCGSVFDFNIKRHDHHIIPRAYGGVDGPQVSLCSGHHTAVHEIALRLWTGKTHHDLLTADTQVNKKLLYLAQCAHNARVLVENDPNKLQLVVLSLNKEMVTRLQDLKVVYKMSRPQLIELAIKQLHSKHFIAR